MFLHHLLSIHYYPPIIIEEDLSKDDLGFALRSKPDGFVNSPIVS